MKRDLGKQMNKIKEYLRETLLGEDFKPPWPAFHSRLVLPLLWNSEERISERSVKLDRINLEVILNKLFCGIDAYSHVPET